MSDEPLAPASEQTVEAVAPAPADNKAINVSEAARHLNAWRQQKNKPADPPAEAAPAEAAPKELAAKPTSDPPEAPAETTKPDEPAELPPIEPPRSWKPEEKERFNSLPRETQEFLAQREQERDRELRRIQNKSADDDKAIKAELDKAEQVRKQYEEALPMLLRTLQEQQQGEFADIRTMADVERLAREDWPRYALWDAQQKKIAAVMQEVNAAKGRQESEAKQKWAKFASDEDAKLIEKAPELADRAKAQKVADAALEVLRDVGFDDSELNGLWNGDKPLYLRDHRLQLLLLNGVKYREAKANSAKPLPKPVPPVQKPGVAKVPGEAARANIESMADKLSKARGLEAVRVAANLQRARREANR